MGRDRFGAATPSGPFVAAGCNATVAEFLAKGLVLPFSFKFIPKQCFAQGCEAKKGVYLCVTGHPGSD
jgi:hypothetical protein